VLSLGQQVNVRPRGFDPTKDCLGAMVVEVDFLMKKKLVIIVHLISHFCTIIHFSVSYSFVCPL